MIKNELPSELFPEEEIRLIIESINESKPQYINNVRNENLSTQNGKYHSIWNYVFKNIKNHFNVFPYKCYKISRGNLWEFISIYNETYNILYVVMKEERFKEIKKGKNKDYHYIKILNSINNDIKKDNCEQVSLFEKDENKEKYIKNDLERMLGDINGKVKICVDILFSMNQNKVVTISGNIFDYNLDKIKSYSWNKYIRADIDEIIDTKDEYDIESPLIELPIKKNKNKLSNNKETNIKEMVASKKKQKGELGKNKTCI